MNRQPSGIPRTPPITKRNDERASNHSELDDPNVFDGVAQRPNKHDCNDEVSERQPVRAIADEGIFGVARDDAVANFSEPAKQARLFQVGTVGRAYDSGQQVDFGFQRDGRYAADDQSKDKNPK